MKMYTRHIQIARQHLALGNATTYHSQMDAMVRSAGSNRAVNFLKATIAADTAKTQEQ